MDWTEKYRPKTLDGVIGNPTAVNTLRSWAKSWDNGIPQMRAVVLMGTPGIGKTTSAEALAREMGWGIIEMNASDQRTGKDIEQIALRGSLFNTFSDDGSYLDSSKGMRKLIVLDEADNFFGNADRGAMPVINELIKTTRQPVILIVNDFYALSRKSSIVKNNTLQITFKKPQATTMAKALYAIADNEGIDVDPAAMELIAKNADGDMRAAVRNLESLALGQTEITLEMAEGLSKREVRSDMYELMSAIFRRDDPSAAREVLRGIDAEPSDVQMWVDENLPYEFTEPGDLVRGYEKMSRADIFLGRVHKRQYYRFWAYANDLHTMGVSTARMSSKVSRERIKFPGYLMKMSRSKSVRVLRASVVMKIAVFLHTSTRRAESDVLPFLKEMLKNDPPLRESVARDMELEPEELAFLIGSKPDSKEIKKIYEAIESEAEERRISSSKSTVTESIPVPKKKTEPIVTVKTIDPEPEPPKAEPKAAPKPKGQRSLFDF